MQHRPPCRSLLIEKHQFIPERGIMISRAIIDILIEKCDFVMLELGYHIKEKDAILS